MFEAWDFLAFRHQRDIRMPTRRFNNLSPDEQGVVVDAFLGVEGGVDFTEKLAGQHLSVVVRPGGSVEYIGKGGVRETGGGLFPVVNGALRKYHPPVEDEVAYEFEVLKKGVRPDFVDYPLEKDYTVVDLSGKMSTSVAGSINSAQGKVLFVPRDSIKKSVGGVVKDPGVREELQAYRDRLSSGKKPSKAEALKIEGLLMDLVDGGSIPSTLGSSAIEGLFGVTSGGGFKIPSASYAALQRDQSKFYAVIRTMSMDRIKARFESALDDPRADRLVSDVISYVESASQKTPPRGLRTFFSKEELGGLRALSDAYLAGDVSSGVQLAEEFFGRVKDKGSWVTTEAVGRWQRLAGIL